MPLSNAVRGGGLKQPQSGNQTLGFNNNVTTAEERNLMHVRVICKTRYLKVPHSRSRNP